MYHIKTDFLEIVQFLISFSFCAFDGKFVIIAKWIMRNLEIACIKEMRLNIPPSTNRSKWADSKNIPLPICFLSLKFMVEYENDRLGIPFLDTLVINNPSSGTIKLDWYNKHTHSGRELHFYLNHSINMNLILVKTINKELWESVIMIFWKRTWINYSKGLLTHGIICK